MLYKIQSSWRRHRVTPATSCVTSRALDAPQSSSVCAWKRRATSDVYAPSSSTRSNCASASALADRAFGGGCAAENVNLAAAVGTPAPCTVGVCTACAAGARTFALGPAQCSTSEQAAASRKLLTAPAAHVYGRIADKSRAAFHLQHCTTAEHVIAVLHKVSHRVVAPSISDIQQRGTDAAHAASFVRHGASCACNMHLN